MTKTGRTDNGLTVSMAATQGENQDFGTSTQMESAAGTKGVAATSDEAMASLKEQAKGKTVGDTVSAAFMDNGQVKFYTASVNESGIGLVLTRNATAAEKAVMQGNTESLTNATNETGARGIQNNVAERTEGASTSIKFDVESIRPLLKTDSDTAFFWSGKTDGIGGEKVAANIAKGKGGVTLESIMKSKNILMPEWDFNNPSTMEAWDLVSGAYAEQVSGKVEAVIGSNLREGNVWENIELPRLKNNQNVTKITTIDPKTGVETIIFERK